MYKQLPVNFSENLSLIKDMGAAYLSKFINLRAGRTPVKTPLAQTIINQFNLIESELEEGKLAAAAGDLDGVRDAVCDIVLLAFGQQGHIEGINLDNDFKTMCAYNMTRIPQSVEEAEATIEKYKTLGVETEIKTIFLDTPEFNGYLYPVICLDKDQWDVNGDHYPPKKFVKSVNFVDCTFDEIEGVSIVATDGPLKGLGDLITPTIVEAFVQNICKLGKDTSLNDLNLEDLRENLMTLSGTRA